MAARKGIEFNESSVYVPVRITINEDQFRRSWIGEIYDEIQETYQDRSHYEHFIMIFFVAYQMTLGKKSFWYPYFEVCEGSDLPLHWETTERDMLED